MSPGGRLEASQPRPPNPASISAQVEGSGTPPAALAVDERTGRTKSFYAREAILNHLDEREDLYLAEGRLDDLRKRRSESISLNDLIGRHGVED